MKAAIALEKVAFAYGARALFRDLSLEVQQGEVLALVGPSGSGKSTLLRLALGFVPPQEGFVRLGGVTVSEAGRILQPPEERGLAVVFQDLALWPHLTVHGNLAFGLDAQRVPRHERDERIRSTLEAVGLGECEGRFPGALSGGERQRVAIARALVLRPRAVLLDEPLAKLDPGLKRELLALFGRLLRERGATAVYVTHDVREAVYLGDRLAVLAGGRIVHSGDPNDLAASREHPFVRELLEDLAWGGALDAHHNGGET